MVPPDDLERLFKLEQEVTDVDGHAGRVTLPDEIRAKLEANAKLLAQSALQKNMEQNS